MTRDPHKMIKIIIISKIKISLNETGPRRLQYSVINDIADKFPDSIFIVFRYDSLCFPCLFPADLLCFGFPGTCREMPYKWTDY